MSYSIFYDKQFIKVDDNRVLPIVLGGDNNVYDAFNNRRSRDFYNYSFKRKLAYTLDEMMEEINEIRDSLIKSYPDYTDDRFGWFVGLMINSKSPSFSQFKAFFKTGFDKSLTIEEIGTSVEFYDYERTILRVASDSKTLANVINEIETNIMQKTMIYVSPNFTENAPKILRKKFFPKKPAGKKVIKENDYFYVIVANGYGAFRKATARGFRYSYNLETGKKFTKMSDAKRKVKYLQERFLGHTFEIETVKAKEVVFV